MVWIWVSITLFAMIFFVPAELARFPFALFLIVLGLNFAQVGWSYFQERRAESSGLGVSAQVWLGAAFLIACGLLVLAGFKGWRAPH